jgi:hypothetical protein
LVAAASLARGERRVKAPGVVLESLVTTRSSMLLTAGVTGAMYLASPGLIEKETRTKFCRTTLLIGG